MEEKANSRNLGCKPTRGNTFSEVKRDCPVTCEITFKEIKLNKMGLFSFWLELSLHHTATAILQVEQTEDKLTMLLCKKVSYKPEKAALSFRILTSASITGLLTGLEFGVNS